MIVRANKTTRKMQGLTTVLGVVLTLPLLEAFHIPSSSNNARSVLLKDSKTFRSNRIRIFAGNDDEMNFGPGMEDAFKELESLQSLGGESFPDLSRKPKEKDEAFATAMEGLDLKDILSEAEAESAATSPESELDLYKDMASELDVASSEEDLIAADFKSDLELAESNEAGIPTIDTQKFMDKAINEALAEAREQDSSVNVDDAKEAFLDNKEIMSEIEKIFDKANDDLMGELEEIRAEQVRHYI